VAYALEDYAGPLGNAGVKATSDLTTIMVNFSGRLMHATDMAIRAPLFHKSSATFQ